MPHSRLPAWLAPLFTRRMLICVLTGFSSGMPFYLLISLLPAWLTKEGLDIRLIGLFALTQFPFVWKFLWSPWMDRYAPPLGRRRGWMFLTQVVLLLAIGCLGGFDPNKHLGEVSLLAVAIAFCAATQDVAIDAFRREILPDAELGLGNSIHVNAYRLAGLVPGSLSLILAGHLPWTTVFWITAAFMLPGLGLSVFAKEPAAAVLPKSIEEAVVEPFREFFSRKGIGAALLFLLFLLLYKLGDSLATALSTPFYLKMGYSLADIGLVAKHAALWPAVFGGIAGGLAMVRIGINKALWLFGLVQIATIAGFMWLALQGPFAPDAIGLAEKLSLALVIGAEYLGVGLGTAAFTAFIAQATNPIYTATQFALFTSLTAVPRTLINASAGWLVDRLGWPCFFFLCYVLAIPGMLLLLKVAPWAGNKEIKRNI